MIINKILIIKNCDIMNIVKYIFCDKKNKLL